MMSSTKGQTIKEAVEPSEGQEVALLLFGQAEVTTETLVEAEAIAVTIVEQGIYLLAGIEAEAAGMQTEGPFTGTTKKS